MLELLSGQRPFYELRHESMIYLAIARGDRPTRVCPPLRHFASFVMRPVSFKNLPMCGKSADHRPWRLSKQSRHYRSCMLRMCLTLIPWISSRQAPGKHEILSNTSSSTTRGYHVLLPK
ncbi:uncharacterized protein EI90DRAFT_1306285 [Cantharellus anzutake]|uniref:uncharacterized protein n=1 Tax=Cantharellus anzutake TaxID=1750568 RepID=UPI001902E975|nr:uncharacterized protein EI90DRAFT_1306285 [Cantharellus anzutake]KAF8342141.1 hypothetical protein EI90DRAFT_1306285 [Cantharellus anzutake]